jgi:AcrR family transcriptional regulator
MTSTQSTRIRRRRSDAIDNERRVRAAAMSVFERRGHAMTMDDVAEEAGVSKGTVYNTYGSRTELVDDTTVRFLEQAERHYRAAAERPSAWDALLEVVLTPTIGVAANAEVLDPDAKDGPVKDAFTRLCAALEDLLERGKAEGTIRPEITVEMMKILFRGLYLVLPEYSLERAAVAREYGMIILRGLHT